MTLRLPLRKIFESVYTASPRGCSQAWNSYFSWPCWVQIGSALGDMAECSDNLHSGGTAPRKLRLSGSGYARQIEVYNWRDMAMDMYSAPGSEYRDILAECER